MDSTTTRSPAQVATAIFDALRRHALDEVAELDHPDVVADFVAIGEYRGVPAVRAFFEELFAAFPDFDIEVVQLTADEERAVVQWRSTGTFTGAPFQGIHATGRAIELRGCDVMRVEDGRVVANTIYYDGLGFARQIGMLPREGSPGDKAMTLAFNTSTDVRARLHRRVVHEAPV